MCGIVGLLQFRPGLIDPEAIKIARDALYNRGPDDAGIWYDQYIGLGHRRLAILDLSPAGHQPMLSKNERYVIAFNGEIYNFMELRSRLNEDGSAWHSHSDTEVILAAYNKWGAECLTQLQGMFAFAIWDRERKSLFAARDRLGVKPFYFHYSSSCFAFSSRPRALFSLGLKLSNEINEEALRLFLECGYVPAPLSIHQSIRKLPPAHYILVEGNELSVTRYWDYRHIAPEPAWESRGEKELLDELDEIVLRSIHSRMISDAPLGAFLSGGIDSSLVVAMMSKISSQKVKTFTIAFEDKRYDESDHALAVAQYLNTEHHCQHLKVDDLISLMPTFLREYDEPFFDSSSFPTLAVSRLARQHVTVALSGDGGDELFGGYHYYQIAKTLSPLFKIPHPFRRAFAAFLRAIPKHQIQLLAGALAQPNSIAAFAFMRSISKDFFGLFLPRIGRESIRMEDLFSETAKSFPRELAPSEYAMRFDISHTLPDDYLQKVDVASMAFSLEAREPLLDQALVEWAMKLPLKWKIRHLKNKYLLRQLTYRYIPQQLIDRPKQGFGVPIDRWLRGPLKEWALERLNDTSLFVGTPLNQSRAIELYDLHQSGEREVHPLLWGLLMFLEFKNQNAF